MLGNLLEISLLKRTKKFLESKNNYYLCVAITYSERWWHTFAGFRLRQEIHEGLEGSSTLKLYLLWEDIDGLTVNRYAQLARLAWVDKMIYDRRNNVPKVLRNLLTRNR